MIDPKSFIELSVLGQIYVKSRPRFSRGHAYTATPYANFKKRVIADLKTQYNGLPVKVTSMIVYIMGKHTGDPDNTVGALLDCMKDAGILVDDKLRNIPNLTIRYRPDSLPKGAVIRLVDVKEYGNDTE